MCAASFSEAVGGSRGGRSKNGMCFCPGTLRGIRSAFVVGFGEAVKVKAQCADSISFARDYGQIVALMRTFANWLAFDGRVS